MASEAEVLLGELRDKVKNAKNVPMSASAMLNRAEVLDMIDRIGDALEEGIREAKRISSTSLETLERAQEEAQQIIRQAEERAEFLAAETNVGQVAQRQAKELKERSERESQALMKETDSFVDNRMATFEAALLNTLNQVKTMRAKLSDRSGLDAEEMDFDSTSIISRVPRD
ncbi:MAG: hypothetical protein LBR21_03685 [Propionibacteriaceae bacterium]|jgi:vacuolar-type H+-ATPase subunit H|nr:hypothetical protein [Propionibacteriaceae bacterium]